MRKKLIIGVISVLTITIFSACGGQDTKNSIKSNENTEQKVAKDINEDNTEEITSVLPMSTELTDKISFHGEYMGKQSEMITEYMQDEVLSKEEKNELLSCMSDIKENAVEIKELNESTTDGILKGYIDEFADCVIKLSPYYEEGLNSLNYDLINKATEIIQESNGYMNKATERVLELTVKISN